VLKHSSSTLRYIYGISNHPSGDYLCYFHSLFYGFDSFKIRVSGAKMGSALCLFVSFDGPFAFIGPQPVSSAVYMVWVAALFSRERPPGS
jgi:hypothetical protein